MQKFAVAAVLVVTSPAFADSIAQAGQCYSIQNADARAACLAKAHKDPSRCYAVQSPDKRAECIAEVKGRL